MRKDYEDPTMEIIELDEYIVTDAGGDIGGVIGASSGTAQHQFGQH